MAPTWVASTLTLAPDCADAVRTTKPCGRHEVGYRYDLQTWTLSDLRLRTEVTVSAGMYDLRNDAGGRLCHYAHSCADDPPVGDHDSGGRQHYDHREARCGDRCQPRPCGMMRPVGQQLEGADDPRAVTAHVGQSAIPGCVGHDVPYPSPGGGEGAWSPAGPGRERRPVSTARDRADPGGTPLLSGPGRYGPA